MGARVLHLTAVTLALLVAGPVIAQEATDEPAGTAVETDAADAADPALVPTDTATVPATTDNDGFDWGWLGLLGLAGLAGLGGRRRHDDVVRTTTTTR